MIVGSPWVCHPLAQNRCLPAGNRLLINTLPRDGSWSKWRLVLQKKTEKKWYVKKNSAETATTHTLVRLAEHYGRDRQNTKQQLRDKIRTITAQMAHVSIWILIIMEMYWKGHFFVIFMSRIVCVCLERLENVTKHCEIWPFQYVRLLRKCVGNVYLSSSEWESCARMHMELKMNHRL